jgi:hypothetical protein
MPSAVLSIVRKRLCVEMGRRALTYELPICVQYAVGGTPIYVLMTLRVVLSWYDGIGESRRPKVLGGDEVLG